MLDLPHEAAGRAIVGRVAGARHWPKVQKRSRSTARPGGEPISHTYGRCHARSFVLMVAARDNVHMTSAEEITIRRAQDSDTEALRRLAALDSARVPAGDVLVAEVDGELRAALGVRGRHVVADPFHPSAGLVELLSARAASVRASTLTRGDRVRARLELWAHLWRGASAAHPTA